MKTESNLSRLLELISSFYIEFATSDDPVKKMNATYTQR